MSARQKLIERAVRALESERGRVTAEALVAEAEEKSHPLHHEFEWDNTVAGHKHRLDQARALIRSVKYNFTVEQRPYSTVRYTRDPEQVAKEQGYVNVEQLRTEPENAAATLRYELQQMAARLQRMEGLAAALGLSAEILEIRTRVGDVQSRIAV